MKIFHIQGQKTLSGSITPQGSKNEALQVLAASLLTSKPVYIHNLPNILDIYSNLELLRVIGVEITTINKHSYCLQAKHIHIDGLKDPRAKKYSEKFRGSILLLGPLLARLQEVIIYRPGGDRIGRRKLNTHFDGIKKLGASYQYVKEKEYYKITAAHLKGNYLLLEEASVTGTANLVMAACLAEGKTTIYNAACEPHIQALCNMLIKMGAKITGVGTNLLEIIGQKQLYSVEHTISPDILEIGSFISLAAMTKSSITIQDIKKQDLGMIPTCFQKLGIQLEVGENDIHIPQQTSYTIQKELTETILTIADSPWPGLPPDLLSILLVTAIQAKGEILIHQKMYESRLFFIDKLIEMGAKIILCDPHRANVIGLNHQYPLRGIRMRSPDIRAGISLMIAALSAKGNSCIENVEQIDRGYEKIEERLNHLGAEIKRVSVNV